MKNLILIAFLLLAGCIMRSANTYKYDPLTGRLIEHNGIGEVGWLTIASKKEFWSDVSQAGIRTNIGFMEDRPDAESIKAVSDTMLTELFKFWRPL